ncbi:MAG: hypothetical protein HZC41_08740 [Chloroflexi bacterium]|nr:hypothetical protein [Chloroflexota bacterium]
MACISSPLSEDQLIAAMSEVADRDALEHLQQCPDCRARLLRLQRAENRLKQRLYRWDCPDAALLGNFAFRLLDEADQTRVAEHVHTCPLCRREVEQLRRFLQIVEQTEADDQQRVARRYAPRPARRSTPRVSLPSMGAAAFALRGEVTQPIEFDGVTLILSSFEEDGSPRLVGQLVGPQAAQWKGGLVKARQGEAPPALAVVTERAKFECRLNNTAETIHLTITGKHGQQLVVEAIDLSTG